MAFRELAQPLRGIIPPMVTPLSSSGQLDESGLERLIEHLVTGGVHGLFLLGTCGEGPSLSRQLRRQLVTRVCRQVDNRVMVLAGITDTSLAESMDLARHAADAGADALVLAPPYYYPVEQAELLAYVRRVVSQAPLPVVLYNMPSLTNVAFEPETVRQLLDEEAIVGIKDSSGDLDYFQQLFDLRRKRPDWALFVGPEHLLVRSIELGGDGGVSGGANVWPQLFVRLYEASVAGQTSEIEKLLSEAGRLWKIYDFGPHRASAVIKGLKAALSTLGICNNFVAPPLTRHAPAERDAIGRIIQSLDIAAALTARRVETT